MVSKSLLFFFYFFIEFRSMIGSGVSMLVVDKKKQNLATPFPCLTFTKHKKWTN